MVKLAGVKKTVRQTAIIALTFNYVRVGKVLFTEYNYRNKNMKTFI